MGGPLCGSSLVRAKMLSRSVVVFLLLNTCLKVEAQDLSSRLEPPSGQRCAGRNYSGRRCCTPEQPCGEGEGDCDGPGDGGINDGNRGCRAGLVCGTNNCKKFGAYYHEKDDCCERPSRPQTPSLGGSPSSGDWGPWSKWRCVAPGTLRREQKCRKRACTLRNGRVGSVNTQERYSDTECV